MVSVGQLIILSLISVAHMLRHTCQVIQLTVPKEMCYIMWDFIRRASYNYLQIVSQSEIKMKFEDAVGFPLCRRIYLFYN